ncbi:hypothetical protein [Hymenobacter properus]|uniref:Uncharacterized protein n=1 Tax=Hymenobacter properus TaxID=2791026 RepID=A0A931BE22_9BACT|nr:hypothetical protein [Hymenobacter properus]MBF9140841.1 hypothetical protein [Hymenobacter properus]MBR7719650.1 hypothetical protein [Microvirga sp. SRT04]
MAATAGVFTPSTLATIVRASNDIFKNTPDLYAPKTEVLNEIVKMQTANVTPVTGSAINKVKVAWQDSSAIVAGSCAPACDLDGPETGTDGVEMTLNYCSHTSFKKEVIVGDNPYGLYQNGVIGYAQSVAQDIMRAKQVIQEDAALKMLAKLATFAGVNADTTGQYGATVTGTNTTIPAANWNEGLFPFLQMEAQINRMVRPYILDGVQNGLYLRRLNAIPNALNDSQRDQQAKFNLIEAVFDYFTFAAAGLVNTDFVVDGTAVAFAARNQYAVGAVESPQADHTVFAIPGAISQGMDGQNVGTSLFNIDVEVQRKCETVTRAGRTVKRWFDVYDFTLPYFDLLHDPYRLGGSTNTGVLKVTKV